MKLVVRVTLGSETRAPVAESNSENSMTALVAVLSSGSGSKGLVGHNMRLESTTLGRPVTFRNGDNRTSVVGDCRNGTASLNDRYTSTCKERVLKCGQVGLEKCWRFSRRAGWKYSLVTPSTYFHDTFPSRINDAHGHWREPRR